MKRLIEMSKRIEDKELRDMVVIFLQDLKLSNENFSDYPKMEIEDAVSVFTVGGPSGSTSVERDVLNHTISLVKLSEQAVGIFEDTYNISLNKDAIIAAAIVHDLMKLFEWKRGPQGIEHTGIMLDHTMLAVAELYHRGFPENVIHIVAAHFGETGPTPPRNLEALIFHQLDNMASMVEFRVYGEAQHEAMQLLLMDEDMIKKMMEETKTGEFSEKSEND